MDFRGLATGAALTVLAACEGPAAAPTAQASDATSAPARSAPPSPSPATSPTPSALPSPRASAAEPPALPVSYPPRDECAKLPGFAAFREKVAAAAKARNADALIALADPAINLDFGGGAGLEELRKRLADPKAELWRAIAALNGLGCAVDGGVATQPWIFARLPDGFDDASTALYGTGQSLPLRAAPAPDARLLARLTWPVVELEGPAGEATAFDKVRLSDGTVGYMETAKLRSLLDYRLIADRQGGEWKITALIAGD